MKYISGLTFEDEPDYKLLREIVNEELVKSGCKLDNKLEFKLAKLTDNKNENKENLEPSLLFGPSKKPPAERVSAVFDTSCVSETSYEQTRDRILLERAAASLQNPTQAMLDILQKLQRNTISPQVRQQKGRKRTKSFIVDEKTENTPAMLQVLRMKRSKVGEESSDESDQDQSGELTASSTRTRTNKIPLNRSKSAPEKCKSNPRKTELERLGGSSCGQDEPSQL